MNLSGLQWTSAETAQDEMQKLIMRSKTNLNDLISSPRIEASLSSLMTIIAVCNSTLVKNIRQKDKILTISIIETMRSSFDVKSNNISERLDDNLLEAASNKTSTNGFGLVDPR